TTPTALGARRRHDLTLAVAVGADMGGDDGAEQGLRLRPDLAAAVTTRAGALAVRSRLGSVAVAVRASALALALDLHGLAVARLFERDVQLGRVVLAATAAAAGPPRRGAAAERRSEDVEDVPGEGDARRLGATVAVVPVALLRIGEYRVRLVDGLELLFRLAVPGVAVGVVGQRQLPVGGLDGLGVGGSFDLEDGVVIGHAPASIPKPLRCSVGRSRRGGRRRWLGPAEPRSGAHVPRCPGDRPPLDEGQPPLRLKDWSRRAASSGSISPRSSRSSTSVRPSARSGPTS